MAEIKLPSVPRQAYDPMRPPNTLLLTHARELEKALIEAGRAVRRQKPKTEGQVAAYIRHLNRALHHQQLMPQMARRRLDVPLDALSPGPAKRRPAASPKKRAATRPPRAKKTSRTQNKQKASVARSRKRSR
jgi:hypothetical protein